MLAFLEAPVATRPGAAPAWRHGAGRELPLLASAMDSASDGITVIVLEPSGHVRLVYANAAFCAMSGYSREDVIGRDCGFLHQGDRNCVAAATIRRGIEQRQPATATLVQRRKSGEPFWVELKLSPISGEAGAGTHFVCVLRDVTGQQAELEALRTANVQLERQADALRLSNASLDAFAAAVSHDLRAPLALIRTFVELAQRAPEDSADKRASHLQYIRHAADRMERMTAALLQLARVSSVPLRLQPIDLSDMAVTACQMLQLQHPRREVDVQVQPGMTALADPALLGAVLDNLLSNAWKFTARMRSARVCVGSLGSGAQTGAVQVFYVQDNGAGFRAKGSGSDFGVFRRHHPESDFPGNGVGLASAQHILARHGGELWAESAPGCGATLFFSLPRPVAGPPVIP